MVPFLFTPLRAFHQDSALKARYLARIQAHQRAGEVVRGRGPGAPTDTPTGWCGSAAGCTVHVADAPYTAAETQLGVPRLLVQLEDLLFEGLSAERRQTWASDFLQAVPVGANLTAVWPQLATWLLLDANDGLLRLAKTDEQRQTIRGAAALYQQPLLGADAAPDEWQATVNTAETVAYAALAQAMTALKTYAASLAANAAAEEDLAAAQANKATQAAAETTRASATAAARAAARTKALGLGSKAAASAATKAVARTVATAAAKTAALDRAAGSDTLLADVQAAIAANVEASRAATQTAEAAVAWAAYAALAADAERHVAAAATAQVAADDYGTVYSLQAADTAYATAFQAALTCVKLYTTPGFFNGRATPMQDHLADKLLELLAAAPAAAG
ncbi:MAG: hypothetical protein ACRYFX_18105 [Janthinobacterium lividum]